jgi:hypothetical protein
MIVNDGLENARKETAAYYREDISFNVPGETEENH